MVKAADGNPRASAKGGGTSTGGSGGSGSRLPRDAQSLSVSLIHQRNDVAINLDVHSLVGSAEITLQPHVPVESIQNFKLHAHGLDIHSVTVDGTPAKFSTRHWSYVTPSGWSKPEVMADLRNRGGTTLKSLEANELDDGELVISNPSYVPPPPPTPTKPATAPVPSTLASLLKPSGCGGETASRPSTPSALVKALEAASPPKPKQVPPPSVMPSSSPVPPSSSSSPSPPPPLPQRPPLQPPAVPGAQPSTSSASPLAAFAPPATSSTDPAAPDSSATAKPVVPAPDSSATPTISSDTPLEPLQPPQPQPEPIQPPQPEPIQAPEPKPAAPKPPTYPPLRIHIHYSLAASPASPTVVFATDAHGHSYFHAACLPQPASSQVPGLPIGGTARHWMPCIDRIHERGAWDLHVSVVPETAVVAATGRLVSKVTPEGDGEGDSEGQGDAEEVEGGQVGDGVVRYHYRVDDPIGAPLVALAASTAFEERVIPLDIPVPDESTSASYEQSSRTTPTAASASSDAGGTAGKSSQSAAAAAAINPADLIKPRYPPAAIRVYYPAWIPSHLVDHATHVMSATLDYYSNAFGMYPWGEFGEHRVVFAPEVQSRMFTNHGAGMTVLDAQAWLASVSPEMVERTFEQRKEIMMAFAYQWFGCFVLPKNWGDFWCILGLCQFMSGRLFRLHFGHSEFTYRLKRDMERLAVLDVHMPPLYWSPHPSTDFLALKSGLIMHALDKKMTKVAASAGVASMIHKMLAQGPASLSVNALAVAAGAAAAVAAKHAWRPSVDGGDSASDAMDEVADKAAHARRQAEAAAAATAQLMVLSNSAMVRWARKESSADGLKGFFEQWVSTPGVPRIQFEYSQNNGRQVIEFDMSQQNTSQWARKQGMRGLFTGTVTVKVFEIDGEVYTHTLDIARPSQHFEVRFNSRYKYKKMLGKTTETSVPSIEEQLQQVNGGGGGGGASGDTDWVKQVAGEGSSDAAANAEAQKRWIQWVWVDPEGEWPCPILLIQPDYKWLRLLTHSPVSVLSQFDVLAHLRDHPSVVVAKQLFAVATSANVYYRLRLDAVSTLATCATNKHDWIGLELLAKILRQFAVPMNMAHKSQISAAARDAPAVGHASDPLLKLVPLPQVWDQRLEDYLVFRATVAALVSIRDHMGRTPRQIKQLAINLLTYTDAPATVGSGVDFRAHVAFLTQCLCEAMVDTPTPAARAAAATKAAAQVKLEQIKVEEQQQHQQQAQGARASSLLSSAAAPPAGGAVPSAAAVGASQAPEPPRPSLIEETASRFAGIAETMDFGLDDFDDEEDDEDDTSTMMSLQPMDVDAMQVDDQATSGAGDGQPEDRMDVDGEPSASTTCATGAPAAAAAVKPQPAPQGLGRFALDFEPCPEMVDEALELLERFRMLELVRLADSSGETFVDADEGAFSSSAATNIGLDDGNLTATLLSCFCRWMIAGLVPTRLELFLGYTETGLPLGVRKIAFQSIVLLNGFLVLDIARYLMAVVEDDPSPSMRIFVANLLANVARLAGNADKYDFQDSIALTVEAREQLRTTYTEFVGAHFMDDIYKLLASPTVYRDVHVLLMDTVRHLYFHQGPAVRVKFPVGTAAKHTPLLLASPAALYAGVPYAGAASLLSSSGSSRAVAAMVPPPFRPPPPPRPASPPRAPGSRGWHPAYQGVSPNQKVGSISPTMGIAGLFILESLRSEAGYIDGFLEPVSPLDFPEYYKLITDPMDISCIDKRFRNGHYTHVDQIFVDVDKIWRNCFIFNDEASAIAQSAKHLSEKCETKIKPGARAIMAAADEMRQQPRTITEDEVRKIKRINRKMRESYVAGWFKEPVRDVPGYYDVIKAPMDLTTVRRRIEHHEYPNRGCFDNDTRQIFRNCEQFNPPGSQVREACDVLKKLYNEEFAREFPEEKRVLKIRNTMPGMPKRSESPQVKAEPITEAPMGGVSVPPVTIKREPSFHAILSPPPLLPSSQASAASVAASAAASLPSPPHLPPSVPPPPPPARSSTLPPANVPAIKPLVVKAPKPIQSEPVPVASESQPAPQPPAPNRPAQPPREVERTNSLPVFKIRAPARPPAPSSSSSSSGPAPIPALLIPPPAPPATSAPGPAEALPLAHEEMYSMLKRLYGHDKSLDFRSPVDVVLYNIPTYPKVIKQPMDLQTMFKKLDAGTYRSPLDFFDDLLLTCRNAITFNQVGTIVHEAAKEFYDEIKREFRTTFGASNLPRLSQVPKGKIDHNPPRPTLPVRYLEPSSAPATAQAQAPAPPLVPRHQPHISVVPPPLALASSSALPSSSQPPLSQPPLPPLPKSTPIVRAKFSVGAPSIPREPTPSPASSPIVSRASLPSSSSRTSLAASASTSSLAPLATASSSSSSLLAAPTMSASAAGRTRYDVPMTPWHRFRLIDDLHKVTISTRSADQKRADPFLVPVDPVHDNLPQYLDYVSRPMDLGTMRARLVTEWYRNVSEVVEDINQVYENCMLFNGMDNDLTTFADELRTKFLRKVDATLSDGRGLTQETLNTAFDTPHPDAAFDQRLAGDILRKLKAQRHAGTFWAPVDPVRFNIPQYPEIIQWPMDFGTIEGKVQANRYNTMGGFVRDVFLVFDDCFKFNNFCDMVYVQARQLQAVFHAECRGRVSVNVVSRLAATWAPPRPVLRKRTSWESDGDEEDDDDDEDDGESAIPRRGSGVFGLSSSSSSLLVGLGYKRFKLDA